MPFTLPVRLPIRHASRGFFDVEIDGELKTFRVVLSEVTQADTKAADELRKTVMKKHPDTSNNIRGQRGYHKHLRKGGKRAANKATRRICVVNDTA